MSERENKPLAVILAGGFGERTMGTLGEIPKLLIKTADGKTILGHVIQDLESAGLRTAIVTNDIFYDKINKFVPEDVSLINDKRRKPEERLGALGDLLLFTDSAREGKNDEDVLVLPSDTAYWESFSIKDFLAFAKNRPDSFVTVAYDTGDKGKIKGNLGCVELDGNFQVISFEEKPEEPKSTLAIIAIYLFRPEHIKLLREFRGKGGDLNSPSNIIPFLMKEGIKISVFLSKGKVIDANGPQEISEVSSY